MTKYVLYFFAFLCISTSIYAQGSDMSSKINALLATKTNKPFNGAIIIAQKGVVYYAKNNGYSNLEKKTDLTLNDQFVIGSISKQITAVLVLQEYEKGHLKLDAPIINYLPELTQRWADTVTIQQLLSHTHGINDVSKPLAFPAGTQYAYSQLGYELLAKIVERVSLKTFSELAAALFTRCNMKNTVDPSAQTPKNLVTAYTEQKDGSLTIEKECLQNPVPAGGFISTANDLLLWNESLFGGKLLASSTFKLLTTKQPNAVREHPVFGTTDYGLGITVDTKEDILQYGQTGFAPGFASMDFYFPETKTSVIILENIAYYPEDLSKTFHYHTDILKLIRESSFVLRKSH